MSPKALDTFYLLVLNLTSLGWVANAVTEFLPIFESALVVLSIVFLNVAKGIHWLRKKKENKDGEISE